MIGQSCLAGLFDTAGGPLALPAERIQTVLDAPRIFPVPGVADPFLGVLLYRDQVVPLIDWFDRFSPASSAPFAYVVLVTTDYGLVGLPVNQVRQVTEGTIEERFSPGGNTDPGEGLAFRGGENLYPLVDVDQMVGNLPGKS